MQTQTQQWAELYKSAQVSAKKWANINTNLLMNLTQQKMERVGIVVETGNKQVQALAQSKRAQDVWEAETQLVEKFNKNMLNSFRGTVDTLVDAKNQLTELAEEGMKKAADFNPWLQPQPQSNQ